MTFLDALARETNVAYTENNAITNRSSLDSVLDFFALAGAMRNNQAEAVRLFRLAYADDPQAAARVLFYLRDIRGGQGERDLFRTLYKELKRLDSVTANSLLLHIPEYGRWDDLIEVADLDPLSYIVENQLVKDLNRLHSGESVSLLAKWLPSENASSKNSRILARHLASALGISNKEYRKTVVALRKHIRLLEQQMSANDWENVDYSKLPSQAGRKHAKAFGRHDQERFTEFLARAQRGEAKLNAGTVFAYEVYDMVQRGEVEAANAFWANLPDYTNGKNALVMADVSGSMFWGTKPAPISVSVSLALYFAEHNTGPFHDYFMTFSGSPELIKVRGANLQQRMENISRANWQMNTNLYLAFMSILRAAVNNEVDANDMPEILYVISDMEFDEATQNRVTNFTAAKQEFEAAGYTLPTVVFWNVNARNRQVPATKFDGNVTLISGLSQSTFRYVVEGKTPVESMLDVINSERYAPIVVGSLTPADTVESEDGAPGTSGYMSFAVGE